MHRESGLSGHLNSRGLFEKDGRGGSVLGSVCSTIPPSSLSAIRVVSSAYLRFLIFLPAILIPACASSSPAFLMMYSAYKLNKQGDNIQP